MFVRHLSTADFRSWERADLELVPGPCVLVGPNGQGKTNLIEAIGYLATLGSHRVATDAPLVRSGAARAIVAAAVVSQGRELQVEIEITPGKANRAKLNRSPVPRARDVLGALRSVLFAPEDLAIVRGDPGERRRFLDDVLVQRRPSLAAVRADYDRVLRQRGALLKTAGYARRSAVRGSSARRPGSAGSADSAEATGSAGDLRTLDVWDEQLAEHGAALLAARLRLLDELTGPVVRAYAEVAPKAAPLRLTYSSSLSDADTVLATRDESVLRAVLLADLARLRPQEVERGMTLVGPHRDDLMLTLGDLPVRGYASHGESWSTALALRLGSYELLRDDGVDPVLILDDVFAELDTSRRDHLAAVAGGVEQVIITAAVAADVPPALLGARYDVHSGQIRRVL